MPPIRHVRPVRSGRILTSALRASAIVLIAIATIGGVWPAVLASVAGFLLLNWFFVPPIHTWTIANGRDEGFTKLLFDETTHRVLGGGIVGTHAGDLISEIALAVEMGADAVDIGRTIHPHPTLSESVGFAAEVFEGVCTDLPPARKK